MTDSVISGLARLGFAAKAVLYMTIGALATLGALRLGGSPATGSRGAMSALLTAPAGRFLIGIIAVGLFGYAFWRVTEAITDPERNGTNAKGVALRVQSAVTGAVHFVLAISAVKIATGHLSAAQDGAKAQGWTARALATPGGTFVLWIVAASLVGYGAYQLYCAWHTKLDKRLAISGLSPPTRRFVIFASRFGIAARGVVFATTGLLVARAIEHHDPKQARGLKQSMLELFELGRWPFLLVATGLFAYGIYQLLEARYRRIAVQSPL